jgi:hypothetical protein
MKDSPREFSRMHTHPHVHQPHQQALGLFAPIEILPGQCLTIPKVDFAAKSLGIEAAYQIGRIRSGAFQESETDPFSSIEALCSTASEKAT